MFSSGSACDKNAKGMDGSWAEVEEKWTEYKKCCRGRQCISATNKESGFATGAGGGCAVNYDMEITDQELFKFADSGTGIAGAGYAGCSMGPGAG
eukprot:7546331-Ditylum_brightwellii.AAC.1